MCWVMLLNSPALAFEPLPRTGPAEVAINPAGLEQAMVEFGQVNGLWSVVVVRRGMVVDEAFFVGAADDRHPVWSATKSVTSALTGMVIDQGLLSGVQELLADHLPEDLVLSGTLAQSITLRNLLMMTSGFRWSEDDDWLGWIAAPNPAQFMLDRPLSNLPGVAFNYSSGSSHLPAVMLGDTLGSPLEVFADAQLFEGLGITDWVWDVDPQGRPFGGHGIEWRTEDLAKFGLLFLDGGSWGDQQIIPSQWVDESVTPRFSWGEPWGPLNDLDYGYLWWIAEAGGHHFFMAWGWGGQFAVCVPDLDLVVATAADGEVNALQAETQEKAILGVIVDHLLPSVRPYEVFADGFESGDFQVWLRCCHRPLRRVASLETIGKDR